MSHEDTETSLLVAFLCLKQTQPLMSSSSTTTMKILLVSLLLPLVHSFQFMKGWKLPTHDPHQEAVSQKFGDKSTL